VFADHEAMKRQRQQMAAQQQQQGMQE